MMYDAFVIWCMVYDATPIIFLDDLPGIIKRKRTRIASSCTGSDFSCFLMDFTTSDTATVITSRWGKLKILIYKINKKNAFLNCTCICLHNWHCVITLWNTINLISATKYKLSYGTLLHHSKYITFMPFHEFSLCNLFHSRPLRGNFPSSEQWYTETTVFHSGWVVDSCISLWFQSSMWKDTSSLT